MTRRDFITSMGGLAATAALPAFAEGTDCASSASAPVCRREELQSELIAKWNDGTEAVSPQVYGQYLRDGDTRGFWALDALERAFEKVMREAKETTVAGDVPAVWSVYNMGYIVKTRESLFSIDLVHRRDAEFASLLDFALITHNHGDHWRHGFYGAMDGAHKTVVSNFKDNYGVKNWKQDGGYVRGVKTFRIKTTPATADAERSRSWERHGAAQTCGCFSRDAESIPQRLSRRSMRNALYSAICGS